MFSHKKIWSAIDRIAKDSGLTTSGLAKKAGLDPTSFNKSKRIGAGGKLRWPSTESIYKVLKVSNKDLSYFSSLAEPNSFSKLNIIANLQEINKDDKLETINIPRSFSKNTFAVKINNTSLEPFYKNGNTLIISKGENTFKDGDRIVIKTNDDELLVKNFIKQDKKALTISSFENEKNFDKISNENIEWIGKILWVSQ